MFVTNTGFSKVPIFSASLVIISEETPVDIESKVDLDDADAAMAWLESLAAKQGVSEEELLTSPEERSETPPKWVQETEETDF